MRNFVTVFAVGFLLAGIVTAAVLIPSRTDCAPPSARSVEGLFAPCEAQALNQDRANNVVIR